MKYHEIYHEYNETSMRTLSIQEDTAQNTDISTNFLVCKVQTNRLELCNNYAFPQNFHARK